MPTPMASTGVCRSRMQRTSIAVALLTPLGHGLHSGMGRHLLTSRIHVQAAAQDDAVQVIQDGIEFRLFAERGDDHGQTARSHASSKYPAGRRVGLGHFAGRHEILLGPLQSPGPGSPRFRAAHRRAEPGAGGPGPRSGRDPPELARHLLLGRGPYRRGPSPRAAAGRVRGPRGVRRVGMMSPQSLAPIADRYSRPWPGRRRSVLHFPGQSGSDDVLRTMHRGYTVEEFRTIVRAARNRPPRPYLSTDVIVAYPTETTDDLEATVTLSGDGRRFVNVTRFSPRPGTPAAALPPLSSSTAKRRSRQVVEAKTRIGRRRLERWIGWEGPGPYHGARCGRFVGRTVAELPARRASPPVPPGSSRPLWNQGARVTYLLAGTT